VWLVCLTALAADTAGATEEIRAQKPRANRTAAFEVVVNVPDNEKAARSRQAIAHMREILTTVIKHLEEARRERDVVKLNCVNEKLTSVKGLLRVSEQSDVTMQETLARRDPENAAHEFEKIMIAERKCDILLAETEACIGELAVYAGDTQVEVLLEGIPKGDPTVQQYQVVIDMRPPAASPYQ
jgi:hypothetical protein